MNLALLERTIAVIGGILVGVTSAVALYKDWKTPGVENNVFKLMLALLCVGAVVALLAAVGVLGSFGKAA